MSEPQHGLQGGAEQRLDRRACRKGHCDRNRHAVAPVALLLAYSCPQITSKRSTGQIAATAAAPSAAPARLLAALRVITL